jgi:hypothetical protein
MAVTTANTVFTTKVITDAITRPANATQYTAGDAISEVTTNDFFAFSGVCKPPRFSALISGATLISSIATSAGLDADLYLFADNELPTETADNSAWAVTDAELLKCLGKISFAAADWDDAGANSLCDVNNLGLAIKTGRSNIVGQLVARSTYTPTSGEVFTINLKVAQD